MKRFFVFAVCLGLTVSLSGCGNDDNASVRVGNQALGVEDVLEDKIAETDDKASDERTEASDQEIVTEEDKVNEQETQASVTTTDGIDVDLTVLSSTMVYSEVYMMMVSPEDYIGKMIKMGGLFTSYYDENTDKRYFACIIQDATACCAQGVEFVLNDNYVYPDDYPDEGGEICVVGTFGTYEEDGYTYYTLRNAEICELEG